MPDAQGSKWARVVVGAGAGSGMRIASADAGWLRLFGFCLGEVANKSLGIVSGPMTKIEIESLVERGAGAPTRDTFYEKSGSEVVVLVRASRFEDNIVLEMKSIDLFSDDGERREEQDLEEASASSDDTASAASTDDAASCSREEGASLSASFSSSILVEPAVLEPAVSTRKGGRAHLQAAPAHLRAFLARRRDLAREGGEGQRFSRTQTHRSPTEDLCC
ncbi:hypothetical protein T484DRAFT_1932984 [Baffinella frigidus]|nr:hypothetical protein T484DRAFT_1932984 [Cryptophyta sp. CCMP2293]